MKRTLNVNIGSVAFTIDEDAYNALSDYLADVRSRFDESEREEVMADIEARIADIFMENLASERQVVSIELIRRAMNTIGKAEDFGEAKSGNARRYFEKLSHRKLRRSRTDKVFAGVCGGIARYFNIDSVLVRIIAFLLLLPGGSGLLIYLILWLVMPMED